MNTVRSEDRDAGFLADVVISVIISAFMAAAIGTAFVVMLRTTSATTQRVMESNDAQLLSSSFSTDVNGMVELDDNACGATPGLSLLIGVVREDLSRAAYFSNATDRTIVRRTCSETGTTVSERTLIRELSSSQPWVLCDGANCVDGASPEMIEIAIEEVSGFEFRLVGSRRYAPEGSSSGGWTFVILGNGSDVVTASGGSSLTVNGDALINSAAIDWCNCGPSNVTVTGTVIQGPITDPLAALPIPTAGSMPVYTDGDYHGPGIYRDKPLTINNPTAFASGTYITEKGFKVQGSGGVSGTEIFIYNGCATDSPPACSNDGPVTVSGGGTLDITSPTTGTYAGVLIWHARGNTKNVTISGSGAVSALDGTIYAPDAGKFTMGSGSASLTVGGIIAKVVVTSGGGVINVGS